MILIISHPDDVHAQAVTAALDAAGASSTILDLSQFPRNSSLSIRYSTRGEQYLLDWPGQTIDLADVGAVWWRRPQGFVLHDAIHDADQRVFTYNECREAIDGLWQAIPAYWINPPARDDVAHRKVLQLATARRVGLKVPETLITNDPSAVQSFVESLAPQKIIFKSFSATEKSWRETRLFGKSELSLLDDVALAPVIFQRYVESRCDLRITIVGDRVFPCAIDASGTKYPVDFRMNIDDVQMKETCIPAAVEQRLLELMRRLGLVYGAVDMRLTPDGEYFFLEINPAGQWLFVEQRTGQPIAAALAENLAIRDRGAEVKAIKRRAGG